MTKVPSDVSSHSPKQVSAVEILAQRGAFRSTPHSTLHTLRTPDNRCQASTPMTRYTERDFFRLDRSDDAEFYAEPRRARTRARRRQ